MKGHNYNIICTKCRKIHMHPKGHMKHLNLTYKLTPDLAYILGVMYGDGYYLKQRNKNVGIGLGSIDKDFILEFKKNIERYTNDKCTKIRLAQEDYWKNNLYIIHYNSVQFAPFLKQFDINVLNDMLLH